MRRQRRAHHHTDDDEYHPARTESFPNGNSSNDMDDCFQMEHFPRSSAQTRAHLFENTIEAKVEDGDTLQALALRFHCTVADIKRLNKIDKDNEIHARKVVKIPVTVHSVLLGTLPDVHKSGQNSPNRTPHTNGDNGEFSVGRNTLDEAHVALGEKLLVASVNAAGAGGEAGSMSINSVLLNSKLSPTNIYADDPVPGRDYSDGTSPLLSGLLDDETLSQPRPIRGPALSTIDWSGSDCDMSWVCLFVVILALCFAIPLAYVIYVTEHSNRHSTT